MRLHVRASGLYTYPDLTIVCGEPELEDDYLDTLLNPMTLIEVLSPSTERYDRGRKAEHYRTIVSLQEYLLVSQDQPRIELYSRAGEGQWTLSEAIGLGDGIALHGIDKAVPLVEVYAGVDFG